MKDPLQLKPIHLDPDRIEVMDDATVHILRTMTIEQKFFMANRMREAAYRFVSTTVQRYHPDWSGQQVHDETILILSDGEVDLADVRSRMAQSASNK